MTEIVTVTITLISQLLPLIGGNSTAINNVITTLIQLIPAVTKEVIALVPMVKNIIAVLQDDPATTAAQLANLATLDAQCDAAFEAAAVDPEADAVP